MKKNAYSIITDRVIEKLNQGVVPWKKPWSTTGVPKNLVSKKPYRGINVFLLSNTGYESPYWITFRQCQNMGGQVIGGEKGTPVVFWKPLEVDSEEVDENNNPLKKTIPLIRYYIVFNVEQCTGIKVPHVEKSPENKFTPIEKCQQIIKAIPNAPTIIHQGERAAYSPELDRITIPKPERFESAAEYYTTLFHEIIHATGSKNRLKRMGVTKPSYFKSHSYGKEELIAEMGAIFLASETGIDTPTFENNTAYISGWLEKLQDDKKLVVAAAAQAQKATDYILNKKPPFPDTANKKVGENQIGRN